MATKVVKWKKLPSLAEWKAGQARLKREAKKRKFKRLLKEGKRRGTNDPGPY